MMDLSKKIWMSTLFIISFGLITLYSATFENVRVPHKIFYDQMVLALIAILIIFIFERVDYRKFYDASYVFYFFNIHECPRFCLPRQYLASVIRNQNHILYPHTAELRDVNGRFDSKHHSRFQ